MITYIMLSIAVIFFTVLDYKREKEFKDHLSILQQFLKADNLWSEEVNNRLIKLDNWVKEHDNKIKNKTSKR